MRRVAVLALAAGALLPVPAAGLGAPAPVALTVEVRPGGVERATRALGASGLRVQRRLGRELQVAAHPARRALLARLPGVRAVRPATAGHEDAVNVSEGLARTGAGTLVEAAGGGRGLTIAVLDMGFGRRLSPLQGAGELPPPDRLEAQSFDPVAGLIGRNAYGNATNHGELVAQTVYDYAPEARYLFVNYHSVADFVAAADWLAARRPDIVVHSNSFLEGPFDGTGPAARAVDRAAAAGVLWVNSAGNYGQRHWEGEWVDAGDDGDLDWPGGEWAFSRGAGQPITFALSWPRAAEGPPPDLDLVLERSDGAGGWEAVAASGDRQAIGEDPAERITGYTSPVDGVFRLRVRRHSGPDPRGRLTLFSREVGLAPVGGGPEGSVPTPGDAAGSLTVGAVDWRGDRLKPYSSRGPTDDGRLKPELTAPTDTRVTGLEVRRAVGGTSIAAPNAAGAAAVLMAARRRAGASADAAAVRAELQARALDLGDPGPDMAFGAGRVRVEAAPPRLRRPTPAPFTPVRARVRVSVSATDRSPLARWALTVDGVPGPRRSGAPRAVSLDTRRLADGFHLLRYEVRDFPGNVGAIEWYLRVDNTPPAVTPAPAEVSPVPAPATAAARSPRRPPDRRRAVALPLTISDAGTTGRLVVSLRLADARGRVVASRVRRVAPGTVRVGLGRRERGRYRASVAVRDPAGNLGRASAAVLVPR